MLAIAARNRGAKSLRVNTEMKIIHILRIRIPIDQ